MHTPSPARLYFPAGHFDIVLLELPTGHAYPAEQLPLQAEVASPVVAPYVPTGHKLQDAARAKLKLPMPHNDAVEEVEPAGQE